MQRNKKLDEAAAGLIRTIVLEHQRGYDSAYSTISSIVVKQLLDQRFSRDEIAHDPLRDFMVYAMASARSHAQLYQDLLVLWVLDEKRGGYFVEIGAGDGVNLSNTLLLEEVFGWTGLLCETNPLLIPKVKAKREALLDERCVAGVSGETVAFGCAEEAEFSKAMTVPDDRHDKNGRRKISFTIDRTTVTLDEMLLENGVPKKFDFLSVDIEGAELEVLSAFPFGKWRFSVAAVEHNYGAARPALIELFEKNGYVQLFSEFSLFDAWFVDRAIFKEISGSGRS